MNRAVDELPVLLNGSLPNHIGRPISRLTDKVVTSSTVSPEKAEKPPPLPPSSNCAGTTITNSDRQQSGSISSIPVLPAAADPVASSETLPPVLEKPNVDLFEWQRIYFSLAKEEKEEEFIHLKNSSNKLPPPCPKKKPKTNNHLQQPESITTNGNSNNNTPSSNTNNGSSKNHGICENSVGGGDILLQWGQNKRSRGSRSENGSTQARQVIKIQRRVATGTEKPPSCNNYPPASTAGYTRGVGLRPCTPLREVTTRNLDELPTMLNGSASSNSGRPISRLTDKRATASPDKATKPPAACPPLPTPANNGHHQESSGPASADEPSNTATPPVKVNMDLFEWPKIYISLSRKEKEDDFMAIKGTKLPQRPKRRAKIVDRNLQYCFPGMWLSDLSRGRYEVREKKCVKKKRRGLKGLESMDSDSD